MSERTYTRADLEAAAAAWSDFGSEWTGARRIAASRGMLYPPAGTRWDNREDGLPSQRAIVFAALDDRPRGTLAIITRARSWNEVVRSILGEEARLRQEADAEERRAAVSGEPTSRQAAESLRSLLGRLR